MKAILIILFLFLILNPVFGQKVFEIPKTDLIDVFFDELPERLEKLKLNDLRSSKDSLIVRIWQSQEVFTISYIDSYSSDYKIFSESDTLVFKSFSFSEELSKSIMDSLSVMRLMNLENDKYRGIDGSFIFIEISTISKYKIVSFWSPFSDRSNDTKIVSQTIKFIDNKIDSQELWKEFWNSLPPGEYRLGMTFQRIDRFLSEENIKTDFYSKIENQIKKEFDITEQTNHWEYPLVIIDGKLVMIADLNKYKNRKISKVEFIKPDNDLRLIYGKNGDSGVVIVETK